MEQRSKQYPHRTAVHTDENRLFFGPGKNHVKCGLLALPYVQGRFAPFDPEVFFGAYYRHQDAVIPVVAMDYRSFRVGLSYDVNISSLSEASGGKGGFEISLGYTGCISSVVDVEPIQWCPRF